MSDLEISDFRVSIDGQLDCNILHFLDINRDLSLPEVRHILSIEVGDRITLGGGAFGTFTVARTQ